MEADGSLTELNKTYCSEKLICNVRRIVVHVERSQLAQIKEPLQQLPAVQLPDAFTPGTPLVKTAADEG